LEKLFHSIYNNN